VEPEPVSPELVLVDPELARRERARLEERAYLDETLNISALRRALEIQSGGVVDAEPRRSRFAELATFSRRRLLPAALMTSLLANGLFVARLVSDHGQQVSAQVAPVALSFASSTVPTSATTLRAPKTPGVSKAFVERKLVSLIIASPTRKLPRNFVDPTTGLVKNNVQVVCNRRGQRSFLCAVRLPSDVANKALYVRYRVVKDGHGVFKWYGYRRS